MGNPIHQDLRLALHRLLDLCRDARARDLDAAVWAWFSTVELHAWACLGQYRYADAARQSRLLGYCLQVEENARRLDGISSRDERRRAA
jgi:hypothetical protein